ncbi:MAG: hypothetical protein WCK37_01880 [Candidatus Falkowbacteria bacterium]
MKNILHKKTGFSTVEALLAASIFVIMVTVLVSGFLYGEESTSLAGGREHANMLAEEGLEAARNIRDASFTNLVDGTYYLSTSSNQWSLTTTPDNLGVFTRQISVGTISANRKMVTSTVTWMQNGQRSGSISLVTYLTNWQVASAPVGHGGMLVYSAGGITNDIMWSKTFSAAGVWSATSSLADIDVSTNRYARAIRVYSSPTRNEKIVISRHYDGTFQYLYAQVYNGTTSTWGNVKALSTITNKNFLDVKNFDGAYLANGNFMAIYSDNATIPKYVVWSGSSWGSQSNLADLSGNGGGIPNFIIARNRPGTNEVMVAIYDQNKDADTEYFNGSTWTLHPIHDVNGVINTEKEIDFTWSPNSPLIGGLVYRGGNNKNIAAQIFTANGSGGGTWSSSTITATQTNNIGALSIAANPKANEFIFCNKDAAAQARIVCFKNDFTPTITVPTNNVLTSVSGTDNGVQLSNALAYPYTNGGPAIAIFGDLSSTTAGFLKKYNTSTATWDSAATLISGLGSQTLTTRLIPDILSNDIMALFANTNQQLFSAVWNGATNLMYTTPVGKALTAHVGTGSADTDFWYDFTWD